jgi:hypothetical protein
VLIFGDSLTKGLFTNPLGIGYHPYSIQLAKLLSLNNSSLNWNKHTNNSQLSHSINTNKNHTSKVFEAGINGEKISSMIPRFTSLITDIGKEINLAIILGFI